MNDPLQNLSPHINIKQVENVTKQIQKKLNIKAKYNWQNQDAFLRNAVVNKMRSDGYDVEIRGKLITFFKQNPSK